MLLACACATAHAQTTPAPASAPADDVDIAKAHFNTGQAYYEHGRFVDAAREFEEAYRLSQKAPLLYNVGKSYDAANDFARALDAYQRFLAAAAPDNRDRDFAAKRVELLQTLVGKVAVEGAVDGSALTIDESRSARRRWPRRSWSIPAAISSPSRTKATRPSSRPSTSPRRRQPTIAAKQTRAVKVVTVVGAHDKDDADLQEVVAVDRRRWRRRRRRRHHRRRRLTSNSSNMGCRRFNCRR